MNAHKFSGLIAATFTPFDENGELNLDVIDEYINFLLDEDIFGIFVAGATGEGLSMTVQERKELAEKWMKVGNGKLKHIIIQVGATNLRDTIELAKHAESMGAHAIGVLPPLFPRPATINSFTEYMRQISIAAPKTPILYYHIPEITSVNFSMEDLLTLASKSVPTLAGIKFSSANLMDLRRCLLLDGGKFQMLFGKDEQYLGAVALGVNAAIGSTYNYMGPTYNRMVEAFANCDMERARQEQDRSQALVKVLQKHGGHNGVQKSIMKLRGLDVGYPRLPVMPLDEDQVDSLKKDLQGIGFFDWCK
ncbi:N-acetylneuraminate lyase-like [Actinia tenebrosa]|uniref:N-acetylneuraminate lyase n=1 Tax=Actinia tenebrosa TaxID=6105 RepID=A0A6P8HFV1_ACTTE|nr:N-acetylneuraminate lyase-like [Actinia tenebrosa]